jgi:hypothetical protein
VYKYPESKDGGYGSRKGKKVAKDPSETYRQNVRGSKPHYLKRRPSAGHFFYSLLKAGQ